MSRLDRHDQLSPEDDWFAEPADAPTVPPEPVDDAPRPAYREARSNHGSRVVAIVGLVAVTIALAGAALAWVLGDSGAEESTTTMTTETTTAEETTPTTPTTVPEQTVPTTTEPASTEPAPVTVRKGDGGEAVRAVQQALADLGYDVAVDGNFGEQTAAAVVAFQTASGLDPDGVVGPATYAALAQAASG
jgi:FlaG/FlaF family flagellin (archaellin)